MITEKPSHLFDINKILSKISLEEGQQVADLGCGNFGFFVFPLARLVGIKGKVYAVDILKSVLDQIKKEAKTRNLPQITPVWSNLEIFKETKIPSNGLDTALIINVLNQSDKRIDFLREAVRLLKRGGKLLIIDWQIGDTPFGPPVTRRVNPENIKAAAPKIGLVLQEEFDAGNYHYGLILMKM